MIQAGYSKWMNIMRVLCNHNTPLRLEEKILKDYYEVSFVI